MARLEVLRTDDFRGGLNLRADPFQLGENESPDLLNVDIDPRGGFSMRGGAVRTNTTAIGSLAANALTPRTLFPWNTSSPQLLASTNGKVFYSTGGNFTDTAAAITSAWGASFAPWSGTSKFVYFATGVGGQCNKWSGTTRTSLTASATAAWQESFASPVGTHMPQADHAATHIDRMWVASTSEDGTAYPDRVRWSHPFFPESWRSVDYIDIVDGGSGITALVPFGGALLVFKQHSIHAIHGYDTDTIQVVKLTGDLGVWSPQCVATTENRLFLFSWPHGLFGWDGSQFVDLFAQLRPMVERGELDESKIAQVYVSLVGRRVWLSLPEATTTAFPTFTYVLDLTLGAWVRYQMGDSHGFGPGCDFVASTGARFPVVLHSTQPYALKVGVESAYQDDVTGTPASFTSYYSTRWQDAGVVSSRKMWRRPDFVVKQPSTDTSLTVTVFRDWEEANPRRIFTVDLSATAEGMLWSSNPADPGWGEADWGANAAGSLFVRGSNLGLARGVQLKVAGPGGKPWGVNSISYKFNPRKVRA
jgi:hypothetical protein